VKTKVLKIITKPNFTARDENVTLTLSENEYQW